MSCEIIRDLIPLYIDNCCSEKSVAVVEEHLKNCPECKKLFDDMNTPPDINTPCEAPKKLSKINDWKASVLQSALFFISFGLITLGVAVESSTAYDDLFNGLVALNLVVPATAFMLSLANWYFVRIYKNKKAFSTCSCLITLGFTVCAYIWSFFHYEINITELFSGGGFFDVMHGVLFLGRIGILLTAVFCVLSKVLSNKYAKMLGKD